MNLLSSLLLICAEAGYRVVTVGLEWYVQSTVVLGIGLAIAALADRKGPAYRSTVYRASIAACFLMMLISVFVHGRHISMINVAPAPAPTAAGRPVSELLINRVRHSLASVQDYLSDTPDIPTLAPQAELDRQSQIYAVIGFVWLAGLVTGLVRLGIGLRVIRRIALNGRQPQIEAAAALCEASEQMRIEAPVMVTSDRASAPYIAGLSRPVIVIPTNLTQSVEPNALRAILGHELIHFQRRDCWWYLVNRVLGVILWPQPLIWATMHRLEQANEEVCDEAAFRFGCAPNVYAKCLVQIAETCSGTADSRVYAASMAGFKSSLGRRVDRIMKGDSKMNGISMSAKGAVVIGAVACSLMGIAAFSVAAPKRGLYPNIGAKRESLRTTSADQSTPETTIRSFIAAINNADIKAASAMVVNGKAETLPGFAEAIKNKVVEFKIKSILSDVKDASAKAAVEITISEKGGKDLTTSEFVNLIKVKDGWMIVPSNDISWLTSGKDPKAMIEPLATLMANPGLMKSAKGSALRSACLSNMKQICLGALMFYQDYNEVFKFTPADFKKRIMPYVKNEQIFKCPDAGGEAYVFNGLAAGKKLAQFMAPAETVLFYEGKNGKLDFRHDGMACVGFVDGHVKMINSTAAGTLRWKP